MAKRGRPPSPRAAAATIVNVKMRLYPDEDDDLIRFFASVPRRLRAVMVKQALRSGLGEGRSESTDPEGGLLETLETFVE